LHGRPFTALLDDVRRERALTALALPDTSVKALAEELGFSEASAFHRAFKRWTGETIGAFRSRPSER
jgi:AraC-like DNA-binding protein